MANHNPLSTRESMSVSCNNTRKLRKPLRRRARRRRIRSAAVTGALILLLMANLAPFFLYFAPRFGALTYLPR